MCLMYVCVNYVCAFVVGCMKLPALPEGEVTSIEIQRSNPYVELGISIVGGNETPLINVVIQEVYRDGVIARDGRLLAGDQILQVMGSSLPPTSPEMSLSFSVSLFLWILDLPMCERGKGLIYLCTG